MAASPSSGSMVRNQSGTDVGNGNGDVHKVDPHRSRAKETIGENSKKKLVTNKTNSTKSNVEKN